MKFFVTLNGRTWEIELDGSQLRVEGQEYHAALHSLPGTPLRLLRLDDRSWLIPLESTGRGVWSAQADGETCEVEALDDRAAHIRSLVDRGVSHAGPVALKAPMPGLVVQVLARAGDEVAAGSSLVVLEAMKMENELKAAVPAIVERVAVSPGQTVEKGEVLVTFHAPLT